jgi:hypothetical protein
MGIRVRNKNVRVLCDCFASVVVNTAVLLSWSLFCARVLEEHRLWFHSLLLSMRIFMC